MHSKTVLYQEITTVDVKLDLSEDGIGHCVRGVPVVNLLSLMTFLFSDKFGITISSATLQKFWEHARKHFEWGERHPAADSGTHIPLALYGDGARYTNSSGFTEKVLCIILNFPLWAPKSTRTSRFLVFAIRESLMVSYTATLWPVYRLMMEQLNFLFQYGISGHKFCLTELRGDWEWHVNALNLRPRWSSNKICFKCGATKTEGDLVYTDYCDEATWVDHRYSHIEFINDVLKPGEMWHLVRNLNHLITFNFGGWAQPGWMDSLQNDGFSRQISKQNLYDQWMPEALSSQLLVFIAVWFAFAGHTICIWDCSIEAMAQQCCFDWKTIHLEFASQLYTL